MLGVPLFVRSSLFRREYHALSWNALFVLPVFRAMPEKEKQGMLA
jgi:hypothetical protein